MRFLPLIFVLSVLLLHRPMMLFGTFANATTILTRWDFALLAVAFLLLQWDMFIRILRTMPKWDKTAIFILLISGLAHFFNNSYFTLESLGLNLVFLTVPLFGCIGKKGLLKILPPILGILWVWNAVLFPLQRMRDIAWVGMPGNWNWNATLILVLTPFAIFEIMRHSDKLGKTFSRILSGGVLLVSLFLFYESHSRAASLGLAVAGSLMLFLHAGKVWRKRLLIGGGTLLMIGVFLLTTFFTAKIDSAMTAEVRPAIWESSLRLLTNNPLGIGAESFEARYIPYKTMEYFMSPHASIRTIHPHNELLNIAILLGIPALLAWCFLTFKGVFLFAKRFRWSQTEMKLVLWGFLVIFIHSMLDLTLFSWPLEMLGFLFAGMLWRPLFLRSGPKTRYLRIPRAIGFVILISVLLSGLINFRATLHFEQSRRANLKGDSSGALNHARAGAELSTAFPEQLYFRIEEAILARKDYLLGLELARRLDATPYRNFGRIHGMKALAYAMLNRDDEAIGEYQADSAAYPHLILPRIGVIAAYARLGRTEEIPDLKEKLNAILRIRGLSESDIRFIMQNPECDEHQIKVRELREKQRKNPR